MSQSIKGLVETSSSLESNFKKWKFYNSKFAKGVLLKVPNMILQELLVLAS